MTTKHAPDRAQRINSALSDPQRLITARFPDAKYRVIRGDDPPGKYLAVSGVGDDVDAVMDAFIERLMYYKIDQRLPVYVLFESTAEHDLFVSHHARPAIARS